MRNLLLLIGLFGILEVVQNAEDFTNGLAKGKRLDIHIFIIIIA